MISDKIKIEQLAYQVDFKPSCGHESRFTVTSTLENTKIVCTECFEHALPHQILSRRNKVTQSSGICFQCQEFKLIRPNIDTGLDFCNRCFDAISVVQDSYDKAYIPRLDVVPDEISPGILYIGQKDCAYNRETLQSLGISRVLICCERLPAYHYPSDKTIMYHRIPLEDSLAQSLVDYLPSAMAFIAQGALRGEKVLVHCNAGVSRSGIIAVEWLRRTVPSLGGNLTAALKEARQIRNKIFPNSNFLKQVEEFIASKEDRPRLSSLFSPIKIFVYGTLMRGMGNHHLLSGATFLGRAVTNEKYAMFCAGVPFVNPSIHQTHIMGELFEVIDQDCLDRLDRLEGHPDWYCRTKIHVSMVPPSAEAEGEGVEAGDSLSTIEAHIYFNTFSEDCFLIESGNFHDASKYVK